MSNIPKLRESQRQARHQRLRKRVVGTSERPRLCVHRSLKNMYVQMIDDSTGKVLFGLSTRNKDVAAKIKGGGNVAAAPVLGESLAEQVLRQGVTKVCFDRGGYLYHGRVKALAEAARKGGLEF